MGDKKIALVWNTVNGIHCQIHVDGELKSETTVNTCTDAYKLFRGLDSEGIEKEYRAPNGYKEPWK